MNRSIDMSAVILTLSPDIHQDHLFTALKQCIDILGGDSSSTHFDDEEEIINMSA